MQKVCLSLSFPIIFCLCCSMSQCNEDKTPGPVTIVRGFVHETKTGKPLANVQLQIVKEYKLFLENKVSFYDIATTGADGSYNLKFTPLGKGTFRLQILHPPLYYQFAPQDPGPASTYNNLLLGSTDTLNFTLTKLVGLTVHLTNKSMHDRSAFHANIFDTNNPANGYSDGGTNKVIDTVYSYHLPQLESYMYQSIFYNPIMSGPNIGGFGDSLSFKKNFYLSTADTSLVIVNP